MATSRVLGLLAVAMLIGVVPAGSQQVSSKPATRDRRVITLEEIEQAQETNAFEILQKLRPEFLRRMSERHNFGIGGTAGASVGGGATTGGAGDSTSGTAAGRAARNDAVGQQFSGDNR